MAQQYVQGGMFGGMTGAPLDWPGVTFGSQPAVVPSIGSSILPNIPGVVSGGGAGGGGANATPTNAPANTLGKPNNPDKTVPGVANVVTGSIGDYFLRIVMVVLGLVFVAVGLNMFRPGTVPVVGKQ